jgi:hypothetical protein
LKGETDFTGETPFIGEVLLPLEMGPAAWTALVALVLLARVASGRVVKSFEGEAGFESSLAMNAL